MSLWKTEDSLETVTDSPETVINILETVTDSQETVTYFRGSYSNKYFR